MGALSEHALRQALLAQLDVGASGKVGTRARPDAGTRDGV